MAHIKIKRAQRKDNGGDNLFEYPAAEEDGCAASGAFCTVPAQGQIKLLRGNYGVQSCVTALLTSSVANVLSSWRSLAGIEKTAFSYLF